MSNERIQLHDSYIDIATKMSEGNPGALTVISQLFSSMGTHFVLLLDSFGIYGTDIYVLWSDICDRDLEKMCGVLMATQQGLFPVKTLKDAAHRQDYSGKKLVPVDELNEKVKMAKTI